MRVLIVAHGHPRFSIGGAEMAAHNLFRALNETEGVDAWFLARATAPIGRHDGTALMSLGQGEREAFIHTDRWQDFWLSNGALDEFQTAFARYVSYVNPDVIHFHHIIGLGMEAILLARRIAPRARIVVTFHEYLAICFHHGQMVKTRRDELCRGASPAECAACFPEYAPGKFFARESFIKDYLSLVDAFVSPSRFLMDRYVAWGLDPARFSIIENGLDQGTVSQTHDGGRRRRFGYFGQLSKFKGLDLLLDAVARVPETLWGDATLSIFGGNLEYQPLDFQARFDDLLSQAGTRARLFGSYQAHELSCLMDQIDWTVVPSIWWENSPLVIQESFLHRRPPIVADIGGMAEKVRNGFDGLHFRARSPQALADRLADALRDETLWERLAANAPVPPGLAVYAAAHLALYRAVPAALRNAA